MRNNIVHIGADELTYEIRGIMDAARKIEKMGVPMHWENIGDPVSKGAQVPKWIQDIIVHTIEGDMKTFGYCPTKGLLATREFLARRAKTNAPHPLTADDILFFNGLGDAIANVYTYLNRGARVIGPSPAYPAHSSAEGAHAGSAHITYDLNPDRGWLPDVVDLRAKVKYNPAISGILIINPGNPTGQIIPREVLEEIVSIAREFDLFIITDEIYARLAYRPEDMTPLATIIGEVPLLVMRGLSKEVPWPGARCGWIEVYNKGADVLFDRYVQTLVDAKALEVCATTLPQAVIPQIFADPRYEKSITEQARKYAHRADVAYDIFKSVVGIIAPKPNGAFYISVVFDGGVLNENQALEISQSDIKKFIETEVRNVCLDKRFVYYLMAHAGICVVPLSGLNSDLAGFRMTLLEPDGEKFESTVRTIAESITKYLNS